MSETGKIQYDGPDIDRGMTQNAYVCNSDTPDTTYSSDIINIKEDKDSNANHQCDESIPVTTAISSENKPKECPLTNHVFNEVLSKHEEIPSKQSEINGVQENIHYLKTCSHVSLNEDSPQSHSTGMNRKTYSKSLDDLAVSNSNIIFSSASSIKHLDKDVILQEFDTQKSKIATSYNITPDTMSTRLPKDILTQDLGSIVKNVHGIFTSMSGSIRNAYSQKTTTHTKPVSYSRNGNILHEIFDDETKSESRHRDLQSATYVDDPQSESDRTDEDVETERLLNVEWREKMLLRDRLRLQQEQLLQKDNALRDLETKVELLKRRAEHADREKDAAVVRYASVECTVIEAKKSAEAAQKAQRAAAAELSLAEGKIRTAQAERRRLCQLYDDKCHELSTTERELAKQREELKELEGRLKWTQGKLRIEMDAYKESAERADRLAQRVAELEAGKENATAAAGDAARLRQLESELKENQAALILSKHESEELERRLAAATSQRDDARDRLDAASADLRARVAEVDALRETNMRLEQEAAELAALRATAALAESLASQLQREGERAASAEEALCKERARADTCARREASALEHSAHLTAHHVAERARTDHERAKATALAADNASLRDSLAVLRGELAESRAQLDAERQRRASESRALARRVAELTDEAEQVSKKLEWEKGENGVLRKRHATAIRELNRELQRALKRCEQMEAKMPQSEAEGSARTGSVSSLSSGEDHKHHNGVAAETATLDEQDPLRAREPDRQALIERIVQLQRTNARRADRCEFLEEHSRQLTAELKRKARVLRHALASMPKGALATPASDRHKREVVQAGGGAMAAVWDEAGAGDHDALSPQLALEMNRRLHAVLEDALLKNITLKENMDTLGEEIARLKAQNIAK